LPIANGELKTLLPGRGRGGSIQIEIAPGIGIGIEIERIKKSVPKQGRGD